MAFLRTLILLAALFVATLGSEPEGAAGGDKPDDSECGEGREYDKIHPVKERRKKFWKCVEKSNKEQEEAQRKEQEREEEEARRKLAENRAQRKKEASRRKRLRKKADAAMDDAEDEESEAEEEKHKSKGQLKKYKESRKK
eukprot:gnl/TRDRNA2_/TRDRNA2_183242_c0_seq1.p1 gnl/TRDRNA2_/TRDRNA2_183242_c0~~gnl/TRDRNA2_/TRDRNA2_183242_c0_seq1.p1  ORF type:complete len:141 (+),score=47.48 gnl/TRDRNA2_/TRDRNA2_183242_c0_seq1:72-494(+)